MFEKEVILGVMKQNSQTLTKLVEELEDKPLLSQDDARYCEETLKKIESNLRRIRKINSSILISPFFELA